MPLACCIGRFNQMQNDRWMDEEPEHSSNCRFGEDTGENCPWPRPGSEEYERQAKKRRRKRA